MTIWKQAEREGRAETTGAKRRSGDRRGRHPEGPAKPVAVHGHRSEAEVGWRTRPTPRNINALETTKSETLNKPNTKKGHLYEI